MHYWPVALPTRWQPAFRLDVRAISRRAWLSVCIRQCDGCRCLFSKSILCPLGWHCPAACSHWRHGRHGAIVPGRFIVLLAKYIDGNDSDWLHGVSALLYFHSHTIKPSKKPAIGQTLKHLIQNKRTLGIALYAFSNGPPLPFLLRYGAQHLWLKN